MLPQLRNSIFGIIWMLLIIGNGTAQVLDQERHRMAGLRMIGHQIMLDAGDSTSRVLPITKEDDAYRIAFASDFGFDPDVLVTTIHDVVRETKMAKGYIVEVKSCQSEEIVYSFAMEEAKDSIIISCSGRIQPPACYNVFISFDEYDENKLLDFSDQEQIEAEERQVNNMRIPLIALLILASLFIIVMLRNKGQAAKIDPNLIDLGQFQFDVKRAELRMAAKRIELSHKEAELLLLLHQHANHTVKREVILNKVWGDEGDYVGRTLDVFISKLRKKLEADPGIKIVNTRGVGYKLVLAD